MNYGIIAEFNPFHNGHKYIVDCLKQNNENTVTAVMSGSFVQRGECACVSPYARTEMALKNGVDLVLSLPVAYATASAERFAGAGVDILSALGVIDCLGFGSETGDKQRLLSCSQALLSEELDGCIGKYLSQGVSFPQAREKALKEMHGENLSSILSQPNDILGVEYVKALVKNSSPIDFEPVKRIGVSHDSKEENGNICSASMLRDMLNNKSAFTNFVPEETLKILTEYIENGKAPADFKRTEGAVLYKLRLMTPEDFEALPDVSEGLHHRIYSAVRSSSSLDEILEKIKTKRYTHSRIRRIILCAYLGITKQDVLAPVPYIRVLGFTEKGAALLKEIKKKATLPVVTKASDVKSLNSSAQRCFELECTARDLFSLSLPVADVCGKEMTDKIIVL